MNAGKTMLVCALLAAFAAPLASTIPAYGNPAKNGLYAAKPVDEIYLNDGTVLRGTIIQVLSDRVEFDPEGPSVFNEIPRDRIVKIIYADGKPAAVSFDEITSNDGRTFRCTITAVTPEKVIYRTVGSAVDKTIRRSEIKRIRFFDGRTYPSSSSSRKKGVDGLKPGSRTFAFSWVRIAHFAGSGVFPGGRGVERKEQRVFNSYLPDLTHAYMYPRGYRLENSILSGGADLDAYFPYLAMGTEKAGRARFGFKSGVRVRWGYTNVKSSVIGEKNPRRDERTVAKGQLMWYQHISAGPVLNFTCNPQGGDRTLILSLFATVGYVYAGALKPGAGLHNSSQLIVRLSGAFFYGPPFMFVGDPRHIQLHMETFNNTKIRGYTVRMGFGPELAGGKRFPLILGVHFAPSYTRLELGRKIYLYYDAKKIIHQWEMNWEFTVGIHI